MPERLTRVPDVLFMFSNMNVSPTMIAFGGVAGHRKLLADIEGGQAGKLYEGGYDITPTRRLLLDTHLKGPQYLGNGIQQTWPVNPIEDIRRRPPFKNFVINTGAYALMPSSRRSGSVGHLFKNPLLQTVNGDQRNLDGALRDFSQDGYVIATQLCPEVIAETGGRNGYRITHDSLWQRGIRGLIIPSHHLLRSHMDDAAYRLPWRDTLQAVEEVGAQVHGVHVEAGRVDTRHEPDKQRSLSELLAILTGPNAIAQTDMGKVLTEAVGIWRRQRSGLFISWARLKRLHAQQGGVAVQHQNSSAIDKLHAYAGDSKITQARNENMYSMTLHDLYPKLPVSVEIPYNGLLAVRGVRRLSRADFAAVHRDIITSLHEFFAGLPR